ncbi:MAG: 1-acyl-sn-glycerol-3-phosphate acyltransferase, partial [Halothiobacillus sp. 14-55-98]
MLALRRLRAFFRAFYASIVMALGLSAFAVLCLVWLPFAWILRPLLSDGAESGAHGRRIGRR